MSAHAQAHDHAQEERNDPQFGKASIGKLAMWIFLVTDAMSFSGFLLAYGVLRSTQNWPQPSD
jgi:cytochrome c oxidase subunit 3